MHLRQSIGHRAPGKTVKEMVLTQKIWTNNGPCNFGEPFSQDNKYPASYADRNKIYGYKIFDIAK